MAYDKLIPFSFNKNGVFYFERRVPRDLRKHYSTSKIAYSLRTRSSAIAATRAAKAAQQLDEYWYHLRIREVDLPGKHLLRIAQGTFPSPSSGLVATTSTPCVSLSEAVAIYLRLKGNNRPVTFQRAAERSCGYVIDICGDKDLLAYTKADATGFRDALIERRLAGSSITRVFGTVRSVINFAASETGVTLNNPFSLKVYRIRERNPSRANIVRTLYFDVADAN